VKKVKRRRRSVLSSPQREEVLEKAGGRSRVKPLFFPDQAKGKEEWPKEEKTDLSQ